MPIRSTLKARRVTPICKANRDQDVGRNADPVHLEGAPRHTHL